MASIRAKKNKDGEIISYQIRVLKGRDENGKQLDSYIMHRKPSPNMTPKQIEKELNQQAAAFKEKCIQGYSLDNKQTFAQYADYVVDLKERAGAKHSPVYWYRKQLERINPRIGIILFSSVIKAAIHEC